MSTCISREGEYGAHVFEDPAQRFTCSRCFVLDEDAIYTALAEAEQKGAREALLAAADKWQWGEWTLLTQAVKAGSVIGAAQDVTDWLRARAAQIASEVHP